MSIIRVGTVCVFVSDQDRAKAFYVGVLGMELRNDSPMYPGAPNRWLAVAPQGADTEIILYLHDGNWDHYRQTLGKSQALTLEVSGMVALAADLKAKGVTFVQEPDVQPWGASAIIRDSEGNGLILREAPGV